MSKKIKSCLYSIWSGGQPVRDNKGRRPSLTTASAAKAFRTELARKHPKRKYKIVKKCVSYTL